MAKSKEKMMTIRFIKFLDDSTLKECNLKGEGPNKYERNLRKKLKRKVK